MKMVEVKVSELGGAALDYAVAMTINWIEPIFGIGAIRYIEEDLYLMMETPDPDEPDDVTKPSHFTHYEQWSPSRIWSQGGALIEKYKLEIVQGGVSGFACVKSWVFSCMDVDELYPKGATHLIAACRAIVASKFGDTVSVPAELVEGNADLCK